MTTLRKKSCPLQNEAGEHVARPAVGGVGRKRPRQRRADELRVLLVQCVEQTRQDLRIGVVLEVGVRHGAQAIVGSGEAPAITSRVRGSLNPERSTSARKRT